MSAGCVIRAAVPTWTLLALVLVVLPPVWAEDERTRIAAERQSLTERFTAEESACRTRFAVNACLDDVRARRRAALAPLRERELRLAEAERQRRAAITAWGETPGHDSPDHTEG